jgi:putative ABC transport system permease protein
MSIIGKIKFKGLAVEVSSMYETASMILKLETALNLIALATVMMLFGIVLVGVVNSLRMTIRERTREIGAMRAMGMQARDVRNSLLLETWFLSFFATLVGSIVAFIGMWLLSTFVIDNGERPISCLLVGGHLHFKPSFAVIGGYACFIWLILVGAALFPARRAAKMSAAEAMWHNG